jgi:NAD+ kinase
MKIHFTCGHSRLAHQAFVDLTKRYGQAAKTEADICVALGGDGQVLRTLYETIDDAKPVFALRRTESVGFLCNDYGHEDLLIRLHQAQSVTLNPLRLEATLSNDQTQTAWAINEIAVLRETSQAARLRMLKMRSHQGWH